MNSPAVADAGAADLSVLASDTDAARAFKSLRAKLQAFLQVCI
jgi:hypothetical protein